jgi:trk system potassium uptake protein TrkA
MKKKPKNQQVLIIGLGRFGQSLARALVAGGIEVMAMDSREEATEEIAEDVTHVMIADSTEENVLREVGPEL